MATTAYTIHSDYDPEQREQLEIETGQIIGSTEDVVDAWDVEATAAFKRKPPPPPRFVPATSQYNEWGTFGASSSKSTLPSTHSDGISGWYLSMTSKRSSNTPPMRGDIAPAEPSKASTATRESNRNQQSHNKGNWFIQNVLKAEEISTTTTTTPASSLADILSRDPPPLPSETKYRPPVWLAIGPSNKGFAMLQNSGWSEGEPLGPDVIRRRRLSDGSQTMVRTSRRRTEKGTHSFKQEAVELDVGDGEIKEIRSVIDLTLSDSDDDGDDEASQIWSIEDTPSESLIPNNGNPSNTSLVDDSGRKALLTPIATVLKSDRLGIGLKAKTFGPHKASLKRVTHSAAALAAHQQRAEEARQRRKQWGRGRKGFIRRDKEEQDRRRNMLAYLNT